MKKLFIYIISTIFTQVTQGARADRASGGEHCVKQTQGAGLVIGTKIKALSNAKITSGDVWNPQLLAN